jgi:hypothetical protein
MLTCVLLWPGLLNAMVIADRKGDGGPAWEVRHHVPLEPWWNVRSPMWDGRIMIGVVTTAVFRDEMMMMMLIMANNHHRH